MKESVRVQSILLFRDMYSFSCKFLNRLLTLVQFYTDYNYGFNRMTHDETHFIVFLFAIRACLLKVRDMQNGGYCRIHYCYRQRQVKTAVLYVAATNLKADTVDM